MKRRNFLFTACQTALITSALNGCADSESVKTGENPVATPESRAEYLETMLKALCTDLGPHPIGSPEYDIAAEIVKKEMQRSLPSVELDTFMYERWMLTSEPELYIGERWIEAYPAHGSSGTPPSGITGIPKKIDDPGGIPYGVTDSKTGEILAYITFSGYGNARPSPYYSFKKEPKCPPIFIIGKQDLPVVDDAVENSTPVRMKVQVEFIPDTPTSNVVGTLPGESSDEMVFLAHLDTVYNSPGANDNTATLILMLMWAHALAGSIPNAGKRPKKTMTFIATNGEEYNKLGAIHYVERRKNEGTLENIKFVFNFDSFTWGPNVIAYSDDGELQSIVHDLNRTHNKKGIVENAKDGFWLDAGPFRETGARALSLNTKGNDVGDFCWHRPNDVPANVSVELVETFYLLMNDLIQRVDNLGTSPL
ncbi:M28 family metallopeptidase [Candidatus Latescibacterota bacterium]